MLVFLNNMDKQNKENLFDLEKFEKLSKEKAKSLLGFEDKKDKVINIDEKCKDFEERLK